MTKINWPYYKPGAPGVPPDFQASQPEQPAQPQPQEGKKNAACDIETSGNTDKVIAGEDAKNYSTLPAITLSYAEGTTQQQDNSYYRQNAKIHNLTELLAVAHYDHVAGIFRNHHRANTDFLNADCIIMDMDNTHSDNPEHWIYPEQLAAQLQNVPFYAVYSRNDMKEKEGRAPRPKYHVYFPLSKEYTKDEDIADMKAALLRLVPEFDAGAKDAARFFYGVDDKPKGLTFTGTVPVDVFLTDHADMFTTSNAPQDLAKTDSGKKKGKGKNAKRGEIIAETTSLLEQIRASMTEGEKDYWYFLDHPDEKTLDTVYQGSRNTRCYNTALYALLHNDEDTAMKYFKARVASCVPPLDSREVADIWKSAQKKAKEIAREEQEEQASASTSTGKKKSRPLNLAVIRDCLDSFHISLKYDVITHDLLVSDLPLQGHGLPPEYAALSSAQRRRLNPKLLPQFVNYMCKANHFTFSETFLYEALNNVAEMNSYNPVKAMLDATTWDKQDRISKLCHVLGLHLMEDIEKANFYAVCVRKWLHQTIALALNDEQTMRQPAFCLVLQGAQGIGKTNLFRALAVKSEWFREGAVIDMRDKDSRIAASSVWICELGELDSTLKKEQSSLKNFLTQTEDRYRPPYGRKEIKLPRRTSFCGTVNPQQVHRDDTGSRRFVYIPIEHIDTDYLFSTMYRQEWAMQLWRQVYEELYTPTPAGYFLTKEEIAYNERNTQAFRTPMKAQTELEDLIDFEECYKPEPQGFMPYTASEVKERLQLRMYSAEQIGKALKYLITVHPHCEFRRTAKRKEYLLPPVPDLNND